MATKIRYSEAYKIATLNSAKLFGIVKASEDFKVPTKTISRWNKEYRIYTVQKMRFFTDEQKKETKFGVVRNGITTNMQADDILVGGWAKVYRKDWQHPSYASVTFDECVQKKSDGTPNSNWTKQPTTMIEKVAKVRALREAFVEDLSGMYEAEEMDEVPPKETTEMTGKEKAEQVVIDAQVEEQAPETITFEEMQ